MKLRISQPAARAVPFILLIILFFVVPADNARPQASSGPSANQASMGMDAASFAAELRNLQREIASNQGTGEQIATVRASLPDQWEVRTADGSYEVSSKLLASWLERAQQDPTQRASLLRDANAWLDEEAREAEGYASTQPQSDDADARAALAQILKRREFRVRDTSSAMERLQQWISDKEERVYEWVVSHIGRHPTGAKVFFVFLLFGVVLWLIAMLVRFWVRRARFDELRAPQSVAIARSWQEWILAARAASDRGDYREAVHSAYWAGISYLEAAELIQADRTRTPREYLRLLSRPRTDATLSLEKPRTALAELTTRLEQVWYGRRPASREDFVDALRQVEGLGCQLP